MEFGTLITLDIGNKMNNYEKVELRNEVLQAAVDYIKNKPKFASKETVTIACFLSGFSCIDVTISIKGKGLSK